MAMDVPEKGLRLLSIFSGALVLLCFPVIFLTWPDSHFQVIQAELSLFGAVLAGLYLMMFRHVAQGHRRSVLTVLVGTSGLLVVECLGVVITSLRFD